jgi:hypothetical protein
MPLMWRKLQHWSAVRACGAIGGAPGTGARTRSRRAARFALPFVVASGALLAGCSGSEVRAPNPTRALDERRAIEVIGRAVAQEGLKPAPGREVELLSGRRIRLDVGVQDHQFGVAYVTDDDAQALGAAIPPANRQDEKLRIVRGGQDGSIRIVLLYQGNYVYDDLVGESHERTAITAERQLTRDVQDFTTYARTQKFQ